MPLVSGTRTGIHSVMDVPDGRTAIALTTCEAATAKFLAVK